MTHWTPVDWGLLITAGPPILAGLWLLIVNAFGYARYRRQRDELNFQIEQARIERERRNQVLRDLELERIANPEGEERQDDGELP